MNEEQIKRPPSVLFSLSKHERTDILPPTALSSRLNKLKAYVLSKQFSIDKNAFLEEAIREIFSYPSHPQLANLEYLKQMRTSTSAPFIFLALNDFPVEIKECFEKLRVEQESENVLYEIADLIAEWFLDAPYEYQTALAVYLHDIPLKASRILIAALSDASFLTSNSNLLNCVSLFLKNTDKNLAQTAAAFLLTCGGSLGNNLLQKMLETEELPHSQLIQGIRKLLN